MIRPARPGDAARNIEIWRDAVEATHDFLSPEHLAEIDAQARTHLPAMASWVFTDADDRPLGFMALAAGHIDALFIDPHSHGRGIGRALVAHAQALDSDLTLDVNEQNPLAVGFYERLGFQCTGRSDTDDHGRPYPLLHMALKR